VVNAGDGATVAHLSREHLAQWVDRRLVVSPEIVPGMARFFSAEGRSSGQIFTLTNSCYGADERSRTSDLLITKIGC
jgi:hypothetical protein